LIRSEPSGEHVIARDENQKGEAGGGENQRAETRYGGGRVEKANQQGGRISPLYM
jgi:hypothetical protein